MKPPVTKNITKNYWLSPPNYDYHQQFKVKTCVTLVNQAWTQLFHVSPQLTHNYFTTTPHGCIWNLTSFSNFTCRHRHEITTFMASIWCKIRSILSSNLIQNSIQFGPKLSSILSLIWGQICPHFGSEMSSKITYF